MFKTIASATRLFLLSFAFLLATPNAAHASLLFGPSVYYAQTKTTDNTGFLSSGSSNELIGEGKLGVLIEGTILYFGGIYSYESTSVDGGSKMTGSNYGPTIGIFDGAFAILGSYLLGGTRSYKNGSSENKLSEGTGYRVDVSYVAGIGSSMGLGPQITYKSLKYAKSTPNGATDATSNTYEESRFIPSLILWYRF